MVAKMNGIENLILIIFYLGPGGKKNRQKERRLMKGRINQSISYNFSIYE